MTVAIWLALAGCPQPEAPELELEGPARVRVESLGPVEAPEVAVEGGGEPEGLTWTAEPASVAKVEGGQIEAVGPGEATITGEWQGQTVSWVLVVEPAVLLTIVEPPQKVAVGQSQPLKVQGRMGEETVEPGPLEWSSSAPSILTVTPEGVVTGVSPGVAYVTVKAANGEAMLELAVE